VDELNIMKFITSRDKLVEGDSLRFFIITFIYVKNV